MDSLYFNFRSLSYLLTYLKSPGYKLSRIAVAYHYLLPFLRSQSEIEGYETFKRNVLEAIGPENVALKDVEAWLEDPKQRYSLVGMPFNEIRNAVIDLVEQLLVDYRPETESSFETKLRSMGESLSLTDVEWRTFEFLYIVDNCLGLFDEVCCPSSFDLSPA